MLCQKAGQTGEIIEAGALGVAQEGGSQGRIFCRGRLASNRYERFLKYACAKDVLWGWFRRKLKGGFRRLDLGDGPVDVDGRSGRNGWLQRHPLSPVLSPASQRRGRG